jgi:hypothetical protein
LDLDVGDVHPRPAAIAREWQYAQTAEALGWDWDRAATDGGSPAGQSTTNAQQNTPTGTYPVTIMASADGATQNTATFNLIVTS